MLNKRQARLVNRNTVVTKYLADTENTYSSYAPFQNEVNALQANVGKLDKVLPDKNKNGTGATKTKEELKKDTATNTGNICSLARSYANAVQKAGLQPAIRYTISDLATMKDSDVMSTNTKIYNALLPLVADPVFMTYNITEALLDGMVTDAQAFDDSLGEAKTMGNSSRAANKTINRILAGIGENIAQLLLLSVYFATTDPAFAPGLEKSSRIDNTGIRHNGVSGVVTNAATGAPVKNATLRLEDTDKQVTSDVEGKYALIKVRPKAYEITVAADGYLPQTMIVKIVRGKILAMSVALVKSA